MVRRNQALKVAQVSGVRDILLFSNGSCEPRLWVRCVKLGRSRNAPRTIVTLSEDATRVSRVNIVENRTNGVLKGSKPKVCNQHLCSTLVRLASESSCLHLRGGHL